jgi:membrane protein
VQRVTESLVGRIVVAMLEMRLYDRALTLAGQAFIALVPLLIVLATVLSSADSVAVADWLIDKFSLTGATAESVQGLFERPPSASGGLTFIGFITLLVSASSFARSVQRTYEGAYNIPPRARRRVAYGLAGATVLILTIGILAFVSGLVGAMPGGRAAILIAELCIAVPAWWLGAHLLLAGRVSWYHLLPGAVVSAIGQVLISWGGSIYVPLLIERYANRYGVIGVAIALISWLVVLAFLVVASAVVGAQLGAALAARGTERIG